MIIIFGITNKYIPAIGLGRGVSLSPIPSPNCVPPRIKKETSAPTDTPTFSNSNIDNIEEEVSSDNLETENESEITSVHSEDHSEEQVEEELLVKEEPSVRRLSLFDNISTNESEKSLDQEVKTEPVISENNLIEESSENLDKDVSSENIEPEFNASTDELDEEFNQETQEELLDIPTFLRRQAN